MQLYLGLAAAADDSKFHLESFLDAPPPGAVMSNRMFRRMAANVVGMDRNQWAHEVCG